MTASVTPGRILLETPRLLLRVPCNADTAALVGFLGSERAGFYGGPLDLAAAWRRFAAYTGQWLLRGYGMTALVSRASGETIGLAGPFYPADYPEPELAWLLTEARHEGQGLATEACTALLDWIFSTLGWASVVSYIDRDNAASRALALRLGATLESAPCPLPGCESYRHLPGGAA